MNKTTQYLVNPDVSCRIEDNDGAILYNHDSHGVQVINPVGLEIWETLSTPHTRIQLISHLKVVCAEVPETEVEKDIDSLIEQLEQTGFIGIIEAE